MNGTVKNQYIAVTIGPIFETMSLVASPAALWVSSYIFSYLSRTICEVLCANGVDEKDIITPYFSLHDTALLNKKDGVGLFHDRVIFRAKDFEIKSFGDIRKEALLQLSNTFGLDYGYLQQYIQIAAVKYEAENPILGCDKLLNSMELSKPFVAADNRQPLLQLLFSESNHGNEAIKKIAISLGIYEKWQLSKSGGLKTIEDIVSTSAKPSEAKKKHRYYAIVRADGDNMSQIISSLKGNEPSDATENESQTVKGTFTEFSKNCLAYCSAVADKVQEFGGVTIYAGGDDLLAILPCESGDGRSVFEFVDEANKVFAAHFDAYKKPTSLSFGITVCYKNFPLYEALDESAHMLFGIAKDKKYKNCVALRLQKNAGQSEGLLISNSALSEFLEFKKVIVNEADTAQSERIIVSILHKIKIFEHLLKLAEPDEAHLRTLFLNLFDSTEQKTDFLHETLPRFYGKLLGGLSIRAITDRAVEEDPVTAICYILRVLKFFNEKAGD